MGMSQVKNTMVTNLSASKLTGALPAVDGSALTGVSPFMTNSSDPAIDSNPADGVGSVWANTTSGEMFICTDATAGENVWINVGAGTGDVQSYSFQGTISGYTAGGRASGSVDINTIDKFSLVTDGNATDVGDLTTGRRGNAGSQSSTHGYAAGGTNTGNTVVTTIDKYSFSVDGNASTVGNLTLSRTDQTGHSSSTHGYASGGQHGPTASFYNIIDKFI